MRDNWQASDPRVNVASVYSDICCCSREFFVAAGETSRGRLPAVQHRANRLAKVTFQPCEQNTKVTRDKISLAVMLSISNKLHNAKLQKTPEIVRRV